MLSVCYRYAKNKDDAKDIFQQAFYLVYKNIRQLRDPNALSGWVKRIFVNVALQYYKDKSSLYAVKEISDQEYEIQSTDNPLSRLREQEIIQLIQKLPNGSREIFNMYAIEGYTHKEISEKLGISIGTSKSQLHDARKILKREILKNDRLIVKTNTD